MDKKFPCVNTHLQRNYGTRNGGVERTISEVWNNDAFYIQSGGLSLRGQQLHRQQLHVDADTGVEANPLLTMLMSQHRWLRMVVGILQTSFTIQTVSVWINGKVPAVTESHFDGDHNLVIILHGSCVFWTAPRNAFEPGDTGCRENESSNTPYNGSYFTKRCMSAGMMALQPSGMWHYVESSEHCVKLAIFFS